VNWLPTTFFLVLLASAVGGLALFAKLLRQLRCRHQEVWKSLGSPTLVAGNSPAASFAFIRYLIHREYQRLDDPETIRLASFARGYFICYVAFFVVAAGVISMTARSHGQ
jgi:uncharacterized membrane protein SpoIIM required for sporulation